MFFWPHCKKRVRWMLSSPLPHRSNFLPTLFSYPAFSPYNILHYLVVHYESLAHYPVLWTHLEQSAKPRGTSISLPRSIRAALASQFKELRSAFGRQLDPNFHLSVRDSPLIAPTSSFPFCKLFTPFVHNWGPSYLFQFLFVWAQELFLPDIAKKCDLQDTYYCVLL